MLEGQRQLVLLQPHLLDAQGRLEGVERLFLRHSYPAFLRNGHPLLHPKRLLALPVRAKWQSFVLKVCNCARREGRSLSEQPHLELRLL